MTATFWTASAVTFTNGQKTATVTSGSPFNSSQSYANWKLSSGNKNEPVEVKSASGTQIELFDNWSGPSGSTTVTMEPSPAAAASAGAAAQALITQIQTLVNSASVTATANSFVKRDSGGRTKTATPSANDDAVNKAYLGSAATKDVTASLVDATSGRLLKVGDFGQGTNGTPPTLTDLDSPLTPSGLYLMTSSVTNAASLPSGLSSFGSIHVRPYVTGQIIQDYISVENERATRRYNINDEQWTDWNVGYGTEQLIHAQNASGVGILSNNTISGANLVPAKAGTWRNVSGETILANSYGLWMAV